MTVKDQYKILKKGFTIIRDRNTDIPIEAGPYQIFQKTPGRTEWHNYSRSCKISEREAIKKKLLQDPMIVED